MTTTTRNILLGAAALGALAATLYGSRALARARRARGADRKLDEALDQSFPASDPPATQDFAIPANRA